MRYQNGHFIAVRRIIARDPNGQEVVVLDDHGRRIFSRLPGKDIPEAVGFSLHDASLGRKDLLAVIGVAVSKSNQMASILFIYSIRSGKLQKIVRTSPISPIRVTVDEQNNIWMLGPNVDKMNNNQDSNLLYKMSADGKFLGEYIPRSLLNDTSYKRKLFLGIRFGYPELFANQRGKLFVCLTDHLTFLEMNLNGAIVSQAKMSEFTPNDAYTTPFTIRPDGALLGFLNKGVYRSNRKTGGWEKAVGSSFHWSSLQLIGCDDRNVIVRERRSGKFLWIPLAP